MRKILRPSQTGAHHEVYFFTPPYQEKDKTPVRNKIVLKKTEKRSTKTPQVPYLESPDSDTGSDAQGWKNHVFRNEKSTNASDENPNRVRGPDSGYGEVGWGDAGGSVVKEHALGNRTGYSREL